MNSLVVFFYIDNLGQQNKNKKIFLPNSEEDEEPVGDGWLSLLIVTDTNKL
jgi:hypothetical protein